MAFTPEDGSGLSNSNSYVELSFSNDYFDDRGNATWSGASDTDKQTALVRATDYIDKRFATRFKGRRSSGEQSLQWPRTDATDNDGYDLTGVPTKLKQATCEYAFIALSMALAPNPSTNPGTESSGIVTRRDEQVGPIRESVTYQSTTTSVTQQVTSGSRKVSSNVVSEASLPEYPSADLLLEPCLKVVDNRFTDGSVGDATLTGRNTDNRFDRGQFDNYG